MTTAFEAIATYGELLRALDQLDLDDDCPITLRGAQGAEAEGAKIDIARNDEQGTLEIHSSYFTTD